jgi:acetyl-CoA carboxylase biotin carboxyl carrier protein
MNLKEIKDLVDLITEKGITEFELERGGIRLRIRRGTNSMPQVSLPQVSLQGTAPTLPEPVYQPTAAVNSPAVASALPESSSTPAKMPAEDFHQLKSPMVGTFFEAPSPGAAPFVNQGDWVEVGQVLCIVEAMKLMNEIESDVAGQVIQRYVKNSQPVEYGEALFAIRPTASKK